MFKLLYILSGYFTAIIFFEKALQSFMSKILYHEYSVYGIYAIVKPKNVLQLTVLICQLFIAVNTESIANIWWEMQTNNRQHLEKEEMREYGMKQILGRESEIKA